MGFYQQRVVPWLIHQSMRNRDLVAYRERTVSAALGRVLEIGIGPGLNLPFYGKAVSQVVGLDPLLGFLHVPERGRESLACASHARRGAPLPTGAGIRARGYAIARCRR